MDLRGGDGEVVEAFSDELFMEEALVLARRAYEEGQFPVGCVLVYDNAVIETGARGGTDSGSVNETDHAEMVALRRLAGGAGCGDMGRVSLYCTLEPCLMCFSAIMLSGIGRIVYGYEDVMGGGAGSDRSMMAPLYKNCDIAVVSGVKRKESLQLFKKYFKNPENDYWRGSLLSRYTIKQKT